MSLAPQITNHRKFPLLPRATSVFFSWLLGKISLSPSISAPPRAHSLRLFLLLLGKNSDETKKDEVVDQKQYFQKVLDDVVALNGLFTVAVFLGLSFAQPGQVQSLNDDRSCDPGNNMRKRVVAFEIASFSFFVFSGITAKSVKVYLYTAEKQDALEKRWRLEQLQGTGNEKKRNSFWSLFFQNVEKREAKERKQTLDPESQLKEETRRAHQNWLCVGGFYLSVYGTMVGCLLLLLAMVDVVQIKLGRLACHSKSMSATVSVMIIVIGFSLLIYFFTVTNGLKIAAQVIKKENEDRKGRRDRGKENVNDDTPQEAEKQDKRREVN